MPGSYHTTVEAPGRDAAALPEGLQSTEWLTLLQDATQCDLKLLKVRLCQYEKVIVPDVQWKSQTPGLSATILKVIEPMEGI